MYLHLADNDLQPQTLKEKIEATCPVIEVGWTSFPISFVDNLEVDGDACFGVTDFDNQTVSINTEQSEEMMKQTIIHETWHIIWSTMGLRTHDEDAYAEITTNQEFLVEQTTRGLLLFRKLNPVLYRLLYHD